MSKTINCKRLENIILAFEDGKEVNVLFDMNSLIKFQDTKSLNKLSGESVPEVCALAIYSGSDLTLEEARSLVSELQPSVVTEIMLEWYKSLGINSEAIEDENVKKLTAMFLSAK